MQEIIFLYLTSLLLIPKPHFHLNTAQKDRLLTLLMQYFHLYIHCIRMNMLLLLKLALCREHGAGRVVLFGSRAKGTALPESDIDIAVSGVQDVELLREALEELPTLYKIDLVSLDDCANELLLEDIAKYGREMQEKI